MRCRYAAAAMGIALAACTAPEQVEAPAVTTDEQRALDEAQSMIPASELPPATATPNPTEPARDGE